MNSMHCAGSEEHKDQQWESRRRLPFDNPMLPPSVPKVGRYLTYWVMLTVPQVPSGREATLPYAKWSGSPLLLPSQETLLTAVRY
jgi:hypothetical protein